VAVVDAEGRQVTRYRLAIFDFDGTLADSFPWFLQRVNQVADRHRFNRIEEHEIEALRGYGARQMMAHLRMPAWRLPLVARDMHRLMAKDIHTLRLFPGVPDMLHGLADAGVVLALVTSNSYDNVRRVLGPEAAGLMAHVECGASMFGKRARYRRVLRRSGIPVAQAISIGDEIRDAEASRKAGIDFGGVAWGYTSPAGLRAQSPAVFFDTVDDIVRVLTAAHSPTSDRP
jgi:phosphoglycolate phosphatase